MSYSAMNFGAMEQAYAAFQQKYSQMTQGLDDLEKSCESKLSTWEGSAQESYRNAKTQWDTAAAEVGNIMQKLGTVINSSSENGQSTMQTNAGLF